MKTNNKNTSVGNVGNAYFLQILRSALHVGDTVGNVGNLFRVSYVPTPLLPRHFLGGKSNGGIFPLIGSGASA